MSACRSGKNVKRLFKMGYQEWGEMTGDDMQCWLVLDHPLGISHPSARAVAHPAGSSLVFPEWAGTILLRRLFSSVCSICCWTGRQRSARESGK
jgi:hypothetical protein